MSAAVGSAAHAPSPALTPPPGNPRFPLFDGLRAIAVIAVLLGHAGFDSGAIQFAWYGELVGNLDMGVTIFFVISGFLLYRPFVAADMERRPEPTLKQFFRRRILRIVPAYWFALTVLAIYPGLADVHSGNWWKYYFFLQIYTGGFDAIQGIGQAWSLCVEVSFYLVLPFYAIALRRLVGGDPRRRMRVDLIVLGVLGASSFTLRSVLLLDGGGRALLMLPCFMYWFALGMGLAVLSAWSHSTGAEPGWIRLTRNRSGLLWIWAAGFYVLLAMLTVRPTGVGTLVGAHQFIWHHLLTGIVALLLVMPAVFSGSAATAGVPRRVLALPVMAWLGLISYGIFLWHQSALQVLWAHDAWKWFPSSHFLTFALIGLAITIPCAAFSYYVVERPFLRLKEPRRPAGGQRRASVSPSSAAVAPTTRSTR